MEDLSKRGTRKELEGKRNARALEREHEEVHRLRVRARPCFPGTRYKLTRRCSEQRYFMVPDDKVEKLNEFIGYALAHCLEKFDLDLYCAVFMSNHYHLDVFDPHGDMPAFKQLFNSLVARGVNALRGRFEGFWTRDAGCDTAAIDGHDTVNDLVYTLTNPVSAGLVRNGGRWPGFTTYGWRFGETRTFRRPKWFFRQGESDLPETVTLTLRRPPVYMELGDDELFDKMMVRVKRRERAAQRLMKRRNRRFAGEAKVAKFQWNKHPKKREERFRITPMVARSEDVAGVVRTIQRIKAWRNVYGEAYVRQLRGEQPVFPHGTYWMRRFMNVPVAPTFPRPPP